MLRVAGDHEIIFDVEVVDESASAAAWLYGRVKFVFSGHDYGAAAFDAASHDEVSIGFVYHSCFSMRVCCLLHMRHRILIRDCRGSG